jgi:hypothetical protein
MSSLDWIYISGLRNTRFFVYQQDLMCIWGNALIKLHAYYDSQCFTYGKSEAFDSVPICFFSNKIFIKSRIR